MIAAGIVVGTGLSLSLPTRSFVEPAVAAVRSLADLLAARSPGERAAGAVTTKRPLVKAPHQRAKSLGGPPPEEDAAPVLALLNEAPAASPDVLAPPMLDVPSEADLLPPAILGGPMYGIGGGSFGSVGRIGGGGGGGGGGGTVPGPDDLVPPPAIPEPSTWLTMLVGFGLLGAGLRRNRRSPRTVARPRLRQDGR